MKVLTFYPFVCMKTLVITDSIMFKIPILSATNIIVPLCNSIKKDIFHVTVRIHYICIRKTILEDPSPVTRSEQ